MDKKLKWMANNLEISQTKCTLFPYFLSFYTTAWQWSKKGPKHVAKPLLDYLFLIL